jgi:hypothetical protein
MPAQINVTTAIIDADFTLPSIISILLLLKLRPEKNFHPTAM